MSTYPEPSNIAIPATHQEALNPVWLCKALADISGGAAVTDVEAVDTLETIAAKIRFSVRFAGDDKLYHFCLKAFLVPEIAKSAGTTAVREALFYQRIAPHVPMRVPRSIAHVDLENNCAVLIMEDLIHAGAHFCSALEAFTAEQVALNLDQIARLHAASALLDINPWIPSRLTELATKPHLSMEKQQELLDDPRCSGLSRRTSDASLLLEGMKRLQQRFAAKPLTLLHGDCHAGNFYLTTAGPGVTDWQLVQRGNWAQDVAYHIGAILPEEVAAKEERALLAHYIDCVRRYGGAIPPLDQAWDDYRAAQIYGYYHWAITTRVDPEIIKVFMRRLGSGIERHDTYTLLGL
jgi:hypothetical protein